MAFLNKLGNLLKHSAVKNINHDLSASTPSIFQAIRSMSSSKLFVGGISFNTDDMSLREAFGRYGEVIDARVIVDRETGRSRGFGFITYASTEDASSAIQALDGQDLHGRRIRVNYATERARPGFGGGGGGGYGGGGGGYGGGGYGGGGGSGGYGGGSYGGNDNRGGSYGSSDYGAPASYGGGNAETSFAGGDLGSPSGEFSGNSASGYDGQFGGSQNGSPAADDGESAEPFQDNQPRENNDESDGYAQNRS